jgi:hypothetical protein
MSDHREPPLEIELAEMIQSAAEVDDPMVYRIIDIQIAKRKAERLRASEIVKMLDDGAA